MNLPPALAQNADVAISSTASAGASVALYSSQILDANNLVSFLSLIPAIIGPALAVWMNRMLQARAARKKARADFLEKEAAPLLVDTNPENDAAAKALLLEAAELRAEAEALKGDQHATG